MLLGTSCVARFQGVLLGTGCVARFQGMFQGMFLGPAVSGHMKGPQNADRGPGSRCRGDEQCDWK